MRDLLSEAAARLEALLNAAFLSAAAEGLVPLGVTLRGRCRISDQPEAGDLTATHALSCAAACGLQPQALAELLCSRLSLQGSLFSSVSPQNGFLNARLGDRFYAELSAAFETFDAALVRAMLSGIGIPEQPYAFFSRAAGLREPIPQLSELRQDGGSPLYRLQYAQQRCARLPASLPVSPASMPDADERALLLLLAQLPGTLTLCRREASLTALCRLLDPISAAALRYVRSCRERSVLSPTLSLLHTVLSAFSEFFLTEKTGI